jgi:hypothetical protein
LSNVLGSLVKEKDMQVDPSLPPGMHSLLREDVLSWVRGAASREKSFSNLKREGLSFLEDWENLTEVEQESVGEIMTAIFRTEDLSEPSDNVREIAQRMLEKTPSIPGDL